MKKIVKVESFSENEISSEKPDPKKKCPKKCLSKIKINNLDFQV